MPSQAAAQEPQPGHRLALEGVPTGDLSALSTAIGYWTTSPGFDSRWTPMGGGDGLDAAGRGASKRADRYAVPVVAALDAVADARAAVDQAERDLLRLVASGAAAQALRLVPDDDMLLTVHDEAATQGLYADRLVANLAAIAKGAA